MPILQRKPIKNGGGLKNQTYEQKHLIAFGALKVACNMEVSKGETMLAFCPKVKDASLLKDIRKHVEALGFKVITGPMFDNDYVYVSLENANNKNVYGRFSRELNALRKEVKHTQMHLAKKERE